MASSGFGPRRHLDADAGREVVYCHSCQHEWYSDEQPPRLEPECPRCHSEIVEIVEPGQNDPRIEAAGLGTTPLSFGGGSSSYFSRNRPGSDSDPEEDDIENHLRGGPARSPFGRGPFPLTPGGPEGDDGRAGQNEVFNRFFELIFHDLGGGRVVREDQGVHDHDHSHNHNHTHNHSPVVAPSPSPPRHVHSATFTFVSGPGARPDQPPPIGPLFGPYARSPPRHHHHHTGPHRTVTFVTGGTVANNDPFNRMLAQIMGVPSASMAGPQDPNQPGNRAAGAGPPPMGGGVVGLQQLLATILNPAAAVNGDAVFTQEALDRIITQLMENSPQTNAAPPASESAIESLEKKKVDAELLGPEGKAECTICIDEFKLGDEVTVLPCSHWYHGECVVLWLKEHNTCPICRKPIENREENRRGGNDSGHRSPGADQAASSSSQAQQPQQSSNGPPRMSGFPNPWAPPSSRPDEGASGSSSSFQSPLFSFSTTTRTRTPQENQERLERIRNLGGSQRRSSASPPGAWPEDDNNDSRSSRQRSPSRPRDETWAERGLSGSGSNSGSGTPGESNRRSYFSSFTSAGRDQQSQQQQREGSSSSNNNGNGGSSGSSNPFTWIRDHLSRDRNNGNGNGRR